ncbi:MAG: GxxExxY protein [Bacteroidetes bacterium]|nr:GxxExxY protein [Fibrella sp.]
MTENGIAGVVVDRALRIHRALGPGLLESAYEECSFYELVNAGLLVERQKGLPLYYDSIKMDIGYRVDLLLNHKVIVELKAVDVLTDVHRAQVITYLKLSDCKLGLLINFNVALIKNGIQRLVNNL